MLWYQLRTWAGGEENLVKEIRRTVPPYLYDDVFVIYNERNLRRQGRSIIMREPLFDGCVFLTCQGTEPLFRRLERIPATSRLLAAGYLSILPLMEQDVHFLEEISGNDHVVRVSFILRESEGGSGYRVSGALESLMDGIEKIRFSNRLAKTRRKLWGEELVIPLGFVVNEDIAGKIWYGDSEAYLEAPDHWTMLWIDKSKDGRNRYLAESRAAVLPEKEYAEKAAM